jgi:hypothetical protein
VSLLRWKLPAGLIERNQSNPLNFTWTQWEQAKQLDDDQWEFGMRRLTAGSGDKKKDSGKPKEPTRKK